MNASYEQQIFGELIIPKPTSEKIHKPKIISNPITTSSYSQVNYSNSSYESGKYKKKNRGYCLLQKSNPWKALTSTYHNSSKSQIFDNKDKIENCSSTIQQTRQKLTSKNQVEPYQIELKNRHNQIQEIAKNKLSQSDSFYCACNQLSEQSKIQNKKCLACCNIGSVNGSSKLVKFMEYVMEFKLGIKQSYISKSINQNSQFSVENKPIQQIKEQYLSGYNMQELQVNRKLSPLGQKQKKNKKVTLSNKPTILNKKYHQGNKVNQFCTDFIKNQQNISYQTPPSIQSTVCINNVSGLSQNQSFVSKKSDKNPMYDSQEDSNQYSMNKYGRMSQQINISGINLGINAMSQSIVDVEVANNESFSGSPDRSQGYNFKNQPQIDQLKQFNNKQHIPYQKTNYNKKKPAKPSNLDMESSKSIKNQSKSSFQQQNTKSLVVGTNLQKSSNYSVLAQTQNPRQSLPAQKFMDFNQFKTSLSLKNTIHAGFSCNNCSVNPIVGLRYHCNSFLCDDDYDLCEKCYRDVGHKHCMQQIKLNKNIQKICEGLEQFSNKPINYNTRLSMGVMQKGEIKKDKYYTSMIDQNKYNYKEVEKVEKVGETDQFSYSHMSKTVFKSSIH